MVNNNNHNSPCAYAEQMVSFLYGEIGEAGKSGFESHLRNCASCADELAGFSSVRSSVQEWRVEEFSVLPTPAFEISLSNNGSPISGGGGGWFNSLRSFLSGYPTLIPATGLAAVMVFAGLFWFTAHSPKNNEIAANTNGTGKTPNSIPPLPQQMVAENGSVTAAIDKKVETPNQSEKPAYTVKSHSPGDMTGRPKTSAENFKPRAVPAKVKKSNPAVADRKIEKATPKNSNKNSIPSLATEEYQDNSLRLSDILEEVSLR